MDRVKIWPLILVAAKRQGSGGSVRLFSIAKHLDKPGRGAVLVDDLRRFCSEIGVHDRTFRRWLNQAFVMEIFRLVMQRDGRRKVRMVSWTRCAVAVGRGHVGPRPAELPVKSLVSKGWFAHVWAATLAAFSPIMSRDKLRELTAVPNRTQRALEVEAGVGNRSNYAQSVIPNDRLSGVREFEDEGIPFHAFPGRDGLLWRLPNSRSTAGVAERAARGRTRKINKQLNHLSRMGQVQDEVVRIFHETEDDVRATIHRLAREDIPFWRVKEVFKKIRSGSVADVYSVVPMVS